MDDNIAGKIGELLQNPAIVSLLSQFGSSQEGGPEQAGQEAPPAPAPAPNPLQGNPLQGNPLSGLGLDGDLLQTVMKLAPLLSNLNQEDDSTRFLHALRPLLGPERQKKLDEAAKILQLMRMLPLLRSSGIL